MTETEFLQKLNTIAQRVGRPDFTVPDDPNRRANDWDRQAIVYLLAQAIVQGRMHVTITEEGLPRMTLGQGWPIVLIRELAEMLGASLHRAQALRDSTRYLHVEDDTWVDHSGVAIAQGDLPGQFIPLISPWPAHPYAPVVRKLVELALEPLQPGQPKEPLQRLARCSEPTCRRFFLRERGRRGPRKEHCSKACERKGEYIPSGPDDVRA
ncbi:MAG: hypothetical protein KKI08_03760 [Armatimonadetes bacterium]|nr:hypothetical protein [Armatimonadota bacterium]